MRHAALALLLSACAARPERPVTQALYDDLRAVVATRQRVDWTVDRVELDEAASDILQSVCPTPPSARAELRDWLQARVAESGGPTRDQYAKNPDLGALAEPLTLERVALALDYGDQRATEDCPYWLPPDPAFAGIQGDAGRFVVFAETMGGAQIINEDGDLTFGGLGGGRLLAAYGIGRRLTLGTGAEAGIASTFPRGDEGGRQVRPRAHLGVPVSMRVRERSWRFDTELTATFRATRSEIEGMRPGMRVSQAVGIAALRIAGAMPYGALWAGYEHLPAWNGDPALDVLLIGTRFGVNWDP